MRRTDRTIQELAIGVAPRRAPDSGSTFIEILVSIALLGTVGVAVLVGMAAATRGAAVHDGVATAQSNLASAADLLTDVTPQDDTYESCAVPGDYQALLRSELNVEVTGVDFWDPASKSFDGCDGDDQLQRIKLSSTSRDVTRDLVVLKRPATLPASGSWNGTAGGMVTPTATAGL